ncbi:hypothetical protein ABT272_36695 [Streptomyces sp900105245]|uniref:Uncharacterized protein n=1 Tax=Streptomyces sp. 900105245 TaxID=3154379 RepID=A0ABV1UHN5_9ACTN
MRTQSDSRSVVSPPALKRVAVEVASTGGLGAALLAVGREVGDKHPVPQGTLLGLGAVFAGYGAIRGLWFLLNVVYRLGRSWSQAVLRRVTATVYRTDANDTATVNNAASDDAVRYGGRVVRTAALLLRRGHRATWAQDVVAMTAGSDGAGRLSQLVSLLVCIGKYPVDVARSWLEGLSATTSTLTGLRVDAGRLLHDLWAAVVSGLTAIKASAIRWWHEWWVALLLALFAAVVMEPVMYIVSYWLHHHGLVYPWEKLFPGE